MYLVHISGIQVSGTHKSGKFSHPTSYNDYSGIDPKKGVMTETMECIVPRT